METATHSSGVKTQPMGSPRVGHGWALRLRWAVLAALRFLSLQRVWAALQLCWAGSSWQWLPLSWSKAPEHRLGSCDSQAELSLSVWDLPRPGTELSPTQAGAPREAPPVYFKAGNCFPGPRWSLPHISRNQLGICVCHRSLEPSKYFFVSF